jgi:hypothetical protein
MKYLVKYFCNVQGAPLTLDVAFLIVEICHLAYKFASLTLYMDRDTGMPGKLPFMGKLV